MSPGFILGLRAGGGLLGTACGLWLMIRAVKDLHRKHIGPAIDAARQSWDQLTPLEKLAVVARPQMKRRVVVAAFLLALKQKRNRALLDLFFVVWWAYLVRLNAVALCDRVIEAMEQGVI